MQAGHKGLGLGARDGEKWINLKDKQGIKWTGSGDGFKMPTRFLACTTEEMRLIH